MESVEAFFSHSIVWGIITLLLAAAAFSGRLSMTAANVCVVAAWLTGIFGIYRVLAVFNWAYVPHLLFTLFLASIWGFALYAFSLWLVVLPSPLVNISPEAQRQKDEDIGPLTQLQEPIRIPPASTPQPQPQQVNNTEDELADFIELGTAIQKRFIETNDTNQIVSEKTEWQRKIEEYLEKNLGRSYAIQFRNAQGSAWMGMPAGRSVAGGTVWQEINGKKNMLVTFISELRNRSRQ